MCVKKKCIIGILLSYCMLTRWLKTLYIKAFKRWL